MFNLCEDRNDKLLNNKPKVSLTPIRNYIAE